jgi:hypothetical protein
MGGGCIYDTPQIRQGQSSFTCLNISLTIRHHAVKRKLQRRIVRTPKLRNRAEISNAAK